MGPLTLVAVGWTDSPLSNHGVSPNTSIDAH